MSNHISLAVDFCGLHFATPLVLLSGCVGFGQEYSRVQGFSTNEVGAVCLKGTTLAPRLGNPAHRVYETPGGMLNAIGLQNPGVDHVVTAILPGLDFAATRYIANVSGSSLEEYAEVTRRFDDSPIDAIEINISCPNVKDLTELQDIEMLSNIIDKIITIRKFNEEYHPILLKLSPDIPFEQIDEIIDFVQISGIDGIVATNTTRSREGLVTPCEDVKKIGEGGLSGAPIFEKSLRMVKYIHNRTRGSIPIIGVGGIMTPEQAQEMLDAGASLIEVYTGFIYNGPGYVKKILKHLRNVEKERSLAATTNNTPSA